MRAVINILYLIVFSLLRQESNPTHLMRKKWWCNAFANSGPLLHIVCGASSPWSSRFRGRVLSQTMSSINAAWVHCVALFHAGLKEHKQWWYFLFSFHCSEHTAAVNEGLKCVVRHLEDTIDLVLCECVLSGSTSVLISCTLKGYLRMINEYKLIRKKKKNSFCSPTLVECKYF